MTTILVLARLGLAVAIGAIAAAVGIQPYDWKLYALIGSAALLYGLGYIDGKRGSSYD